jgi:shikimate kinase
VANQARFYDRFEHVILLSAPLHVLLERVAARSGNPYGRKPQERAQIERHCREVEPLLRRGASLELDGQRPVGDLADLVEPLLAGKSVPAAGS